MKQTLTSSNEEEEVVPSRDMFVLGKTVFHNELAVVAAGVVDPQLGDGHVQKVVARVSADFDAFFGLIFVHGERLVGVLEQHSARLKPPAFQVDARWLEAKLLKHTGENHRFSLVPLQELKFTAHFKETNVTQTAALSVEINNQVL